MKKAILFLTLLTASFSYSQENITISFSNDYEVEYHLSLIIYTPDGKIQTRVSDLIPNQIKTYSLPVYTEIFIADLKQETFAMKGNDIKSSGVKPFIIIKESDSKKNIKISSIN